MIYLDILKIDILLANLFRLLLDKCQIQSESNSHSYIHSLIRSFIFFFFRSEIHKTCKIVDVIVPTSKPADSQQQDIIDDSSDSSESNDENEEEKKKLLRFGLDPNKFKYVVESQGSNSNRQTIIATQICRPKGLLTKEKVQILIKNSAEVINNIWIVKVSRLIHYDFDLSLIHYDFDYFSIIG
jgi:hypothetical protein